MWVDDFPFFQGGIRYPVSHNHACSVEKKGVSPLFVSFHLSVIFHWTLELWENKYVTRFFSEDDTLLGNLTYPPWKMAYLSRWFSELPRERWDMFSPSLEGNPNIWSHDQPRGFLTAPCRLVTGSGKFLHVWSLDDEVSDWNKPTMEFFGKPFLGHWKNWDFLKTTGFTRVGPPKKRVVKGLFHSSYPFIRSCLGVKNLIYNW